MMISTLKHNYYVIQKLMDNTNLETYLCKEIKDKSSILYRVVRIKHRDLTYKWITFFMEQKNNAAFVDYYDCFSKDGDLYLVFLHREYQLLMDKLNQEECGLKERLEIGKRILERVLLLNIPTILLYDVLSENSIAVSDSLEIAFDYNLVSIPFFEKIQMKDIQERFLVLLRSLFAHELLTEASDDITNFIKGLSEVEVHNCIEIYQSYEALYEKLSNAETLERIKPNTRAFRLWEYIKKAGKFIKPIFMLAILVLIFGYLIYSIVQQNTDVTEVINYQKIGTVTIE